MISLLQPAPETYELFDDIILLSDGQIVYQGPQEDVLDFFESVGFKCPERKGIADFLQEVYIFPPLTIYLQKDKHCLFCDTVSLCEKLKVQILSR
jgi:ABC-type multidrug transport system ATPase subunit